MAWWCRRGSFRARRRCVVALVVTLAACGGRSSRRDGGETAGDAGTPSTGGTTSTGGTPSFGGTTSAGGASGTGTGAGDPGGTSGVSGMPGIPRCDGLLETPSPVCDYGVQCDDSRDCLFGACYVPGTGKNAICTKYCTATSDCPLGSACIEVGSVGGGYCFVRCTTDEACRAINDSPENPLACVSFDAERVCIQRSEP